LLPLKSNIKHTCCLILSENFLENKNLFHTDNIMNYRKYLLLFLFCANGLFAQAHSANYEEQALSEVLKDLENRYQLHFYYDEDFPINKKVTALIEDMDLSTTILSILNDSNLSFEQYDIRSIVLGSAAKLGNQYSQDFFQARESERNQALERTETTQTIYVVGDVNNPNPSGTIKVKGFVNDDKTGETLIGATILSTTGLGTVSDETGQYELDLIF